MGTSLGKKKSVSTSMRTVKNATAIVETERQRFLLTQGGMLTTLCES